jgi:2-aminoadipate transaminase
MQTLWAERFAQRTQRMTSSTVRELLKLTEQPDIISFGGGLPGPDVFPLERFKEATARVLDRSGRQALQYATTEGYRPLRELVARMVSGEGLRVEPEHVLITTGSQQALDLIGKVFINAGDHILVDKPTYLGALQAWTAYQAEYLPVPMDDEGMCIEPLQVTIRSGPKFLYALPNFQNPTGVSLSMARREAILSLADEHGVPIVEDDPYSALRYEGPALPSLAVLDARRRSFDAPVPPGNVIYTSTFSKTLAPGLRLGCIIAPEQVMIRLVQSKQGTDLHTSTFSQMVAYEVARDGFLEQQIQLIRRVYAERRNAMLDALARYFDDGDVRWTHPLGGLFLWMTMPQGIDTSDMLHEAIAEKVAYVPGVAFFPDGNGHNTMRLNFSYCTPDVIAEGVRRMSVAYKRYAMQHRPKTLVSA